MVSYEAVIGLEIHAQLLTQSKAFCFAPNLFGQSPNTLVGPVSGGLPGALPVLNAEAVRLAIRAGLALNCGINKKSVFSRKNYFYPDLPKGYQITQFDQPICGEGFVDIALESGATKRIGIQRIHIEEDAGKSSHMASSTLVNLNRSGVPLVEIVSMPDMHSPLEAVAYLRKVHAALVYAAVCDGNLEEGNFRCDANVSVRPLKQKTLGTRTELKNINSFRFIEKAIEYEIARQIAVIEGGAKIIQETRGWDSAASKTFTMRTKEEAHDYRYFPEPDLPPLILSDAYISKIAETMPELPDAKKKRFMERYSLNAYHADALTLSREMSEYFEQCVAAGASAQLAANWINSELVRELKECDGDIKRSPISAAQLAELIGFIENATLSGKMAKKVFEQMLASKKSAKDIVREQGLVQVVDVAALEGWVDKVLEAHPALVSDYKGGKEKILGFFVGEVMKLSRGKANPPMVTELIKRKTGVA